MNESFEMLRYLAGWGVTTAVIAFVVTMLRPRGGQEGDL